MTYGDYATREELLENEDVVTRAEIIGDMPEWLINPKRPHSRQTLERAARSTLGKNVIAACDRICALVNAPTFQLRPEHVGVRDLQLDSVEGCVVLRWHENDSTERVLDDGFQDFYNSGEYCEFISAQQVEPTPEAIAAYLRRMEDMLRLAAAVEPLLTLLHTPANVEVRC
jgi:PRTRC genetic system protein F